MTTDTHNVTYQKVVEQAKKTLQALPNPEQIKKITQQSRSLGRHSYRIRNIVESISASVNFDSDFRNNAIELHELTESFNAGLEVNRMLDNQLLAEVFGCLFDCASDWEDCAYVATGGHEPGDTVPIDDVDLLALVWCDIQYAICRLGCSPIWPG